MLSKNMNMVAGRSSSFVLYLSRRTIHCSRYTNNFYVPSKKLGYEIETKANPREVLKYGLKQIPKEFGKLKNEVIDAFKCDQVYLKEHNDYKIMWKFDTPEILEPWVVSSDSDFNLGKSTCEFILNQNNKAVFFGNINTEVPKDGKVKNAGYCNISSPLNEGPFKAERAYDFTMFSHLLVRLRGDGRVYNMGLQLKREIDIQWHDLYTYPLYTRGGPYWQTAKIPFSKFFLTSKGRTQDKQKPVALDRIEKVAITLGDGHSGPFKLELDFIGLIADLSHKSTFDYEMYKTTMHAL